MLDESYRAIRERGSLNAPNLMYFETGQGSELSADAHEGADQVTLEARCYGLARRYSPFLVNTVVGFIGPEYLFDAKQITRAGLEDHMMGKLLGVPLGADACYTNHARADQNDCENLAVLLAAAGCNYFMALPMGDDVDAVVSVHQLPRCGRAACGVEPAAGAGIRAVVRRTRNPARWQTHTPRRRPCARQGNEMRTSEPDGVVTPVRLNIGRAGARYTTASMLKFRADHARAVDAVMTEVSAEWPRKNGLVEFHSEAAHARRLSS